MRDYTTINLDTLMQWLACSPRVGSSHDRVKPKTMKLLFVDFPLRTQH